MFHKAYKLEFKEGTQLELTFRDGWVKRYDMAVLFDRYPQLRALQNRGLFLSGRLLGTSGVRWNDELDIEAETVYQEGETVGRVAVPAGIAAGEAVRAARLSKGLTQQELAAAAGIDQSDLSKIERGARNSTIDTLERIAQALGLQLHIEML